MSEAEQPRGLVVAIDGPSGSGKSSVSCAAAQRLEVRYLDTGAMYRAVTWWCLESGVALDDRAGVARAAEEIELRMGTDPEHPQVHVGSVDITREVRDPRISAAVSAVATNLDVRAELVHRQRELIHASAVHGPGVVAEGRDITTVVAPDADVRILLTADEATRMARRSAQDGVSGADVHDQVVRRDREDATVSQFHVAADGVLTLDSTGLDFEQTVDAVLAAVEAARAVPSAGGIA